MTLGRVFLAVIIAIAMVAPAAHAADYNTLDAMKTDHKATEQSIVELEVNIKRIETEIFNLEAELSQLSAEMYKNRISNLDMLLDAVIDVESAIAYVQYLEIMYSQKQAMRGQMEIEKIRWTDNRAALDVKLAQLTSQMQEFQKQIHFPVVGNSWYIDSWGYPRDGGRRRHKGTDIMAKRGTLVVASTAGHVTRRQGGKAGLYLVLKGDNGWTFKYMHLDSIKVSNGRVLAGQVIGTVGDTGNARGGQPHLHFEIHLPRAGAINPYPYLRSMQYD